MLKGEEIGLEYHDEFISFLMKAKQNTYAGDGVHAAPFRPDSKDLPYAEGEYYYLDSYLGEVHFIGEEAVWHKDVAVWGMNYYGRTLTDRIPEGFGVFLKSALRNVPREAPFRGPAHYKDGNGFEYCCNWEGDIANFRGEEEIRYRRSAIYELSFQGGMVK